MEPPRPDHVAADLRTEESHAVRPFLLLLVVLLLAWARPVAAGWLPIDTVTNRPNDHDLTCENNARAVVADAAGNIHVVWRGSVDGVAQLWYSRFDAVTRQWSEDTVLFPDPRGTMDPVLALDSGGELLVARFLKTPRMLKLCRRSPSSGLWFEVDSLRGVSAESLLSMSVDRAGLVHLVWQYQPQSFHQVRYIQHDGARWLNDTSFAQADGNLTRPAVAASPDGDVMVVWQQSIPSSCILARTRRLGIWQRVDTVYNRTECSSPCVASGPNGSFNVVWVGGLSSSGQWVLHRELTEAGWGETTRVAPRYRPRVSPAVAVDEAGDVHVAWAGDEPVSQQRQLFYRCRVRGNIWKPETMVSVGTRDKGRVSVSSGSGRVQVAWTEDPYGQHPAVRLRRYERLHDVGVIRIVQPAGSIDSGSVIEPVVRVANCGMWTEHDVVVQLRIDSAVQTRILAELEPSQQTEVRFDPWIACEPGWHAVSCSTSVAQDEWPENDVLRDSFLVCIRDAAVDTILEPSGLMLWDTVRPRVVLSNRGNARCTTKATLTIESDSATVYRDSIFVSLLPESSVTVTFRAWLGAPGCYKARCSVACPGDMHPEDDTASSSFELYWIDVAAESIVAPRDTLDSGFVVIPEAAIQNHGSRTANVDVWLRVADYCDSLRVLGLEPGHDTLLQFAPWSAGPPGWNAVRCSVYTAEDMNVRNDVWVGSAFVRLADVCVDSILEPDSVVRTDSVRPSAQVRNRGNVPARVEAQFWIAGESRVYFDSLRTELGPGQDTVLGFRPWPTTVGRFSSCCSLVLEGDMHLENNARRRSFRVVRTDVGVVSIGWPTGVLDSGSVGLPCAMAVNLGSGPETFRVRFRVGTFYDDTVEVPMLASGESVAVVFACCTLLVRGVQSVSCSTLVEGDRNPGNDCQRESVFVSVCDGAVTRILAPLEVIGRGRIEPLAEVANPGNVKDSAWVWFEVSMSGCDARVYVDSEEVELEPGQTRSVTFRVWEAVGGRYDEQCWVVLAGDMRHENDTARASFVVSRTDAAVRAIVSPRSVIQAGWVSPQVRVANLGEEAAQIPVRVVVRRSDSTVVYADSVLAPALEPMCSTVVTLRQWNAAAGMFLLGARAFLVDDENPTNDTLSLVVTVESLASRRWIELAPVPAGEQGRKPRAGARLVSVADRVMALKGGGSAEWFSYGPADSSWHRCADMPRGPSRRRVWGGSALCWDGVNRVYALKGSKTREFYCYDIAGDSWQEMVSLPEHTPKPRHGTGLVFWPDRKGDRVYMVKASGTLDFLVYEIVTKQWHARRFLPPGPWDRKARHGTGLAASGSRMFCIKGGTDEFYEYVAGGDSWLARHPLLLSGSGGRLTRCRKGAALAADATGGIYAFKGGRTSEFWRYEVARDTWIQLEDIPASNSRKRVHDGGSLACLGNRVYALKGGGSSEFWCFDAGGLANKSIRPGNPGSDAVPERNLTRAEPSGLSAVFTRTSVPPVRTAVFDVMGRRVMTAGDRLNPGVYFFRAEQGGRASKVIVELRTQNADTLHP